MRCYPNIYIFHGFVRANSSSPAMLVNEEIIMKSLLITLFVVFVFSGIMVCSVSGADCVKIVQKKCMSCHAPRDICRKDNKNTEYWQATVKRMNRFGADISRKERRIIVGCLADVDSFNKICKP